MHRFSLLGALAAGLLAAAAVPALANTPPISKAQPWSGGASVLVSQASPAGMQERSHRNAVEGDEASSDDADSTDESENDDDHDGGAFADRRDFGPPDENDGPDDRGGYQRGPGLSTEGDGPPGYDDRDRDGQSDEDDEDDENDDSGIHQA